MATRIEKLRRSSSVAKNFMESVFLHNRPEGMTEDVMTYPYRKSDLVYICISTTGRAISQIPIMVYEQVGEEEFRVVPTNDPDQQLFIRPNYLMDRYSFVEATVGHLMLDGDVFLVPFPPGNPISIWVVRKKFMGPIKDRQSNQLIGWNYNTKGVIFDSYGGSILNENSIPLKVEEVCHVYFWNPYDPIMGMAPSEAGRMNILNDFKAGVFTGNFFDEGAVPGGMLQTDKSLGDKQFKRILEQFETRHGGYKKGNRFALLENGLKYTQAGLTQKDMEFPKLREHSGRRIFQIYGMKEAVISETKNVNYATSREQRKEWWESTNLPIMRMICSALSFTLYPVGSKRVCRFDYTKIEALREALRDKVDTAHKLWQMGFTADETNVRLDLGFRPKPWRKVWYQPVNLMPVNGTPVANSNNPPPPPPAEDGEKPPKEIEYEEQKLLPFTKDERKETIWNSMVRQVSPLEEAFAKKVSRVFYNMRRHTLELLYREKKNFLKDTDDVDKETYGAERGELGKVTDPLFKESILLGARLVVEETGMEVAFDLTDPQVLYYLSNKQIKIVGIVETIKDQIQRELIEAYQTGESIDQIADRIRGVFDVAKSRARTIARTEMISSLNEGRFLAIDRSGFREKEWFTAMDERVRPQHQPMHGKKIKVGEMWLLPDGSYLRHPGDYDGPAHQIINCRCIEVVVPESHWSND